MGRVDVLWHSCTFYIGDNMSIIKVQWDASNNTSGRVTEEGYENALLITHGSNSPLLDPDVKVIHPPQEVIDMGFTNSQYIINKRWVLKKCNICEKCKSCSAISLVENKLCVIHCQENKQFYFLTGLQ